MRQTGYYSAGNRRWRRGADEESGKCAWPESRSKLRLYEAVHSRGTFRRQQLTSYLDELYAHQEWADAEHWRALEAHSAALADQAIRERLLHIHLVQHAFLWVTSPNRSEFLFKKLDDFPSMRDLKKYGQEGLEKMSELVKKTDHDRMEELIEVVWFQPTLKISVRQALTQAAMHSHYHRGQNATRLRELRGEPPPTDF